MAWWLRGIAAASHVAGSCQGIASLKARAERSPRGEREADSIETRPPFSPRGFDVPTSSPARGSCASRADEPGASDTQRVHAKSHRLQISSSKCRARPIANSGCARSSLAPSTCDDVRENQGSTEVGALESVHTLTTGCSSALTSRQRGDRARSGTRVLRTHAPKPSVAEQGPPGEAAFGPARSRRKIGTLHPLTA